MKLNDLGKLLGDFGKLFKHVGDLIEAQSAESDTPQAVLTKLEKGLAEIEQKLSDVSEVVAPATLPALITSLERQAAAIRVVIDSDEFERLGLTRQVDLLNKSGSLHMQLGALQGATVLPAVLGAVKGPGGRLLKKLPRIRAEIAERKRLRDSLKATWAILADLAAIAAKVVVL